MKESVPISLVEGWINDLRSILKRASEKSETKADHFVNQGMILGLDHIQGRIKTWLCHQENMDALNRSGQKFLITNDVNHSKGNYRILSWYENDQFIALAWRHAQGADKGELMLELEQVQELHKTYLVYEGNLSFDDLAGLARQGGVDAIKNEENRGEWVEKVWT